MHSIEILIFDGFDELDVVAPFEILASAGFHVHLATFEQRSNVLAHMVYLCVRVGCLARPLTYSSFPAEAGRPGRPPAPGPRFNVAGCPRPLLSAIALVARWQASV